MKKILDLLEQKVQWVALALGVAYVLYMAWTYLIMSPVTVSLNGQELVPGEIDKQVLEVANQLQGRLSDQRVPSNLEKPPEYVADFKATMNYGGQRVEPNLNALAFLTYGPVKLPEGFELPLQNVPPGPQPGPVPGPVVGALEGPVAELPSLTAPKVVSTLTGLSNVNTAPVRPGATVAVQGMDKAWVTVRFEMELDSLAGQWDEKKIPANAQLTSFLRVVLTRQELMPDGSWGNDTVVGPLPIHNVPPYPANSAAAAQFEYIRWAATHTPEILQPPFYPVLKGDAWYIPGEQPPPVNLVADFRPEAYVDAPPDQLMRLPPEQRRAVSAYKSQQQRQNRGRGPAPRGPAPRGGAIDIDLAPIDSGRPMHYQPIDVDQPDPVDNPDVDPAIPAPVTRTTTVIGSGQGKFQFPGGEFDPRVWVAQHPRQPVVGWAHDETASPGGTYRYKVSYKMKNPVFGQRLAVKVAELVDKLALESPDSDWSFPVDVASTVSFFVSGAPRESTGTVPIEVFRWKGGDPHSKVFNVPAGDVIGAPDGDVDYSTGWTIVDFSKDPKPGSTEWVIILMDSKGAIRRRIMSTDMKDSRYQQMKSQVGAAAAAAMP